MPQLKLKRNGRSRWVDEEKIVDAINSGEYQEPDGGWGRYQVTYHLPNGITTTTSYDTYRRSNEMRERTGQTPTGDLYTQKERDRAIRDELLKDETSRGGALIRGGLDFLSFGASNKFFDDETLEADQLHNSGWRTAGQIGAGLATALIPGGGLRLLGGAEELSNAARAERVLAGITSRTPAGIATRAGQGAASLVGIEGRAGNIARAGVAGATEAGIHGAGREIVRQIDDGEGLDGERILSEGLFGAGLGGGLGLAGGAVAEGIGAVGSRIARRGGDIAVGESTQLERLAARRGVSTADDVTPKPGQVIKLARDVESLERQATRFVGTGKFSPEVEQRVQGLLSEVGALRTELGAFRAGSPLSTKVHSSLVAADELSALLRSEGAHIPTSTFSARSIERRLASADHLKGTFSSAADSGRRGLSPGGIFDTIVGGPRSSVGRALGGGIILDTLLDAVRDGGLGGISGLLGPATAGYGGAKLLQKAFADPIRGGLLAGGAATIANTALFPGDRPAGDGDIRKFAKRARQLTPDAVALATTNALDGHPPIVVMKASESARRRQQAILAALDRYVPAPTSALDSIIGGRMPSKGAVAAVADTLRATSSPEAFLVMAARGRLTPSALAQVEFVYPAALAAARSRLLAWIGDGNEMPPALRRAAEVLLGRNIAGADASRDRYRRAMRASVARANARLKQPPGPRPTSRSSAGLAYADPLTAAQDPTKIR